MKIFKKQYYILGVILTIVIATINYNYLSTKSEVKKVEQEISQIEESNMEYDYDKELYFKCNTTLIADSDKSISYCENVVCNEPLLLGEDFYCKKNQEVNITKEEQ